MTGAFFPSFGTVDEGKIEEHDRKPGGKRAMSNLIKAGLVALVLCLAAPVAAGPFEDGADAAERGDFATALQLWQPLANQGDPRAQQSLGNMYANGQGVPQDDAEAVKWFRKAADQGDPYAQFNLGNMYAEARGVPQDDAQAVKWFRKAADQGDPGAQYNLGVTYQRGQGVPQDYAEAIKWYRRAADQDHASAQTNLGYMYAEGQGVPQDYVSAHMWFSVSSAQGNQLAAKNRDNIARRMTPAQIVEAQRLAREWKPTMLPTR
jgi:uncharacterized protein